MVVHPRHSRHGQQRNRVGSGFVTITSAAVVVDGDELAVAVTPSTATKCERCWYYTDDIGSDPAHPTLCGRCVSNLAEAAGTGAGETRAVA